MVLETKMGNPLIFGCVLDKNGAYFSIFSQNAIEVSLHFFKNEFDIQPFASVIFDKKINKTGDVWHIYVKGITEGDMYLYKMDGPYSPSEGHRFNKHKYLLDPYAKALTRKPYRENKNSTYFYDLNSNLADLSFSTETNVHNMPKCIVISDDFEWQGDRPLNYELKDVIIYETHVKSLSSSKNSSSSFNIKRENKGTFLGIVEMIPYFKYLGITSLELLPIQEFDFYEYSDRKNPVTNEPLLNYWGYSTMAFFAPNSYYSSTNVPGAHIKEFKTMVRELHKAGLEVILDIVFNHTNEGNEKGPTFSFKGIENSVYYMLAEDKRYYRNYSGCGNTFNCNHPIVRDFIINCLRYWVVNMHVDGFRFDLASILGRKFDGSVDTNAPMLDNIAKDPILKNTKLIVEPWDAFGAYQVGQFPDRWAEWNDRFRDGVRSFWKSDNHKNGEFAYRFSGSSDIFQKVGKRPFHSINFVTSHDGMTLRDLVSYNDKHNYENGEDNRDGSDNNLSFNYGVEGDTSDPSINKIRTRQMKNFMLTLLFSVGTPMILGGDEICHSKMGNNNSYCQDNHINWYNWEFMHTHKDMFQFTRKLINLRKKHNVLKRKDFFRGKQDGTPDILWFSEFAGPLDWDCERNVMSILIDGQNEKKISGKVDDNFLIMVNASLEDVNFQIPPSPSRYGWKVLIDTYKEYSYDFVSLKDMQKSNLVSLYYTVKSRSTVVLFSFN